MDEYFYLLNENKGKMSKKYLCEISHFARIREFWCFIAVKNNFIIPKSEDIPEFFWDRKKSGLIQPSRYLTNRKIAWNFSIVTVIETSWPPKFYLQIAAIANHNFVNHHLENTAHEYLFWITRPNVNGVALFEQCVNASPLNLTLTRPVIYIYCC